MREKQFFFKLFHKFFFFLQFIQSELIANIKWTKVKIGSIKSSEIKHLPNFGIFNANKLIRHNDFLMFISQIYLIRKL